MIVSVSSPRKRQGQTVSTIMLGAYLANSTGQSICLVDTNKFYSDLDHYLSNAHITKGLQDFCMAKKLGHDIDFKKNCTRQVQENLYVSISSPTVNMNEVYVESLFTHLNKDFDMTLIDCAGINMDGKLYWDRSDVILMLIEQSKNVFTAIKENRSIYERYQNKIIFVVNKYSEQINGIDINYLIQNVNRDLVKALGFERPVMTLPFSVALLNDCNNDALLHFIHSKQNREYINGLRNIVSAILDPETLERYFPNKRLERLEAFNRVLSGRW